MKFFKTSIVLSAFALCFISCGKDDPAPAPEQNGLAGYLTASGFDQVAEEYINSGDYEFGYSFIPLVNGKMTAIVAKIPDAHLAMRVTIWDYATGAILRTETIDIATAGVEVTKTIAALALVKDKEYFITMNSNDWYNRKRTDGADVTYPFTVGDIKITSYSYFDGTDQTLPDSPQTDYYAGDLSFKFQK